MQIKTNKFFFDYFIKKEFEFYFTGSLIKNDFSFSNVFFTDAPSSSHPQITYTFHPNSLIAFKFLSSLSVLASILVCQKFF